MMEFIEKLRSKPDHVKKNVAFFTSLGVTVLIFVLWLASFNIISGTNSNNMAKNTRTPLSSLTASVGDVFGYMRDLFTGGNKVLYQADDNIEVLPKR